MLSKAALKRLNFALTLLTFFCLLPYDWNGKNRRLTWTRFKIKFWLNQLVVYGCTFILTVLPCATLIDVYLENLSPTGTIYLAVLSFIGLMFVILSNSLHAFGNEFIFILNNVFIVDKLVQEELQFPKHVLEAQGAAQDQLVIKFSNAIEPMSLVHTMGVCIIFYEPFDPFRRYFYNKATFLFPFMENPFFEFTCLALYVGFVRLCYSFVIFFGFFFATFVQCMQGWAFLLLWIAEEHLATTSGKPRRKSDMPSKAELKLFRMLRVLNKSLFASHIALRVIPLFLLSAFLPIVIAFYGSVKLFGEINWGTFIMMVSAPCLILYFIGASWTHFASAEETIHELLRLWRMRMLKHDQRHVEIQKFLHAYKEDQAHAGGYFKLNRESFAGFVDQVIDKTITLLLDF